MRLKSIELIGFKSFPEITRLNFERGMTVIVGPNGSGKSNISDAIRWVLGEISAKSVRGSKMEDVIFGGTDNRRQKVFAEVTLTIDNSDIEHRLESDYDELTITRRCSRSGESEYMINRRPVRLRDIAELFMNTGVGRMGYSIIGQGKISEIISQRSEERRSIFEEVSGISKYRYKKNEAEHKIISLDENLNRINDILSELAVRLEPLEKESQKARKYLEIYMQKKQTDISAFLYDIENIKKQINKIDEVYNLAKNEFEIADEALNSFEKQNEQLFELSLENKLKSEQITRRLKEYEENRQSVINARLILQNDIQHIETQIKNSETELDTKRSDFECLLEKQAQIESEYQTYKTGLDNFDSQLIIIEKNLEMLYEQRIRLENLQNENNQIIKNKNEELTEKKIKLSAISNSIDHLIERNNEIKKEIAQYTASSELLHNRIVDAEKFISVHKEKTQVINNSLKQIKEETEIYLNKRKILDDEINRIILDMTSKKQRADTLRRMEELFEGYANSVRKIMLASEAGNLNGIYGPVFRIFDVKPKYAVAIETALGPNIQNIVVENENSAKEAINFLKQNNAGRATFYPLTTIISSPLHIDHHDCESYTGYVGLASDLVTYDAPYREIIKYLLGRTIIADNLENATIMAKATGYRIRIVTLDGQIINTGGSFTGGSVRKDSVILTRSYEIEKLEKDILNSQTLSEQKETAVRLINDSLNDLKIKSDSLYKKLNESNAIYQAEATQLEVLRSGYASNIDRLNDLKSEYEDFYERSEHNESERISINNSVITVEKDLALFIKKASEYEKEHQIQTRIILQEQETCNALRMKRTVQYKDVEAAEKSISLAIDNIRAINAQIENIERILYNYNEKIIIIKNKIDHCDLEIITFDTDIDQLNQALTELNKVIENRDEKLQKLHAKIREQTHLRDNLFKEFNKSETQRTQIVAEQDRITSKLWDEYELTYSSACELRYPKIDESTRASVSALQNELKNKLRALGPVNTGAIDEYSEVKTRHDFLKEQSDDLNKSKDNFNNIIYKLEHEMRKRFSSTMFELSKNFKFVFRELFGGGSAELLLTDPENILESGIEINVAPPGKIIKNLNLLSGGEQAFAAIALLFAILNVNPTPFCVLDEIDAALDDINVNRFADYAKRYSEKTQFIMITHRRGTMEKADTIYGVTMPERGISKILTLNVNEVEQMTGVKF